MSARETVAPDVAAPLDASGLHALHGAWRAANSLSVG